MSVFILSYSEFYCIWTEFEEKLRIFSDSVRMQENIDQYKSKCGHFLRSDFDLNNAKIDKKLHKNILIYYSYFEMHKNL